MRLGIRSLKAFTHLGQDRPHDLTLSFSPGSYEVAFSFHLTSKVWFVQLIPHAVVALDKRNAQLGGMKSE